VFAELLVTTATPEAPAAWPFIASLAELATARRSPAGLNRRQDCPKLFAGSRLIAETWWHPVLVTVRCMKLVNRNPAWSRGRAGTIGNGNFFPRP